MNFFKRTTNWSNAELIIIKLAVLSVGLIAGVHWQAQLRSCIDYIFVLAAVTCVSGLYLWLYKLRR